MVPDRRGGRAIAEVADMLGIPVPTIRSWERRYGFPVPARTRGQHRRYSLEEIDQLRALRDAITQGYSAKDAVGLVRQEPAETATGDRWVAELLRATAHLDPRAIRAALNGAEEDLGVEGALVHVALRGLADVGSRWKAGTCDVATEHLLTDAVRAWLAKLTTLAPREPRGGPVVLACGPRDPHTVGLEAFGMLLARRSLPVLMLGALTPVDSLQRAVVDSHASAAVVVAHRSVNRRSTVESLQAIAPLLGRRAFFAGGAFSAPGSRVEVPGVYLGIDMLEAVRTVERALPASSPPHPHA